MKNSISNRFVSPFEVLDPFFDSFFEEVGRNNSSCLRADVTEGKDCYKIMVEVPSVKKDQIKLAITDGYLELKVTYNNELEEGYSYVFRERTISEATRKFYVGDDVTEKDVNAKLENGLLTLTIKKVEPAKPETKYIEIN